MSSYYIVQFIISANLLTNAGTVYIHVTLLPNWTCLTNTISVNIHEPLQLAIANSNWNERITGLSCLNAENNTYHWEDRNTEGRLAMVTVNKVEHMGTQLQCWIYLDRYEYNKPATCKFALLFNNLDEAMVLINQNLVTATKAEISANYDAYVIYTYKDGETVDFSCRCRSPEKYQHCQTSLYYVDRQGEVKETARTLSPEVGKCMTASLILKLDLSAERNFLSCHANQYLTLIYLKLKIATPEIAYLPTTTPKVLQHQEAPPNTNNPGSHYHPVVTVTSFYSPRAPVDSTTSPAVSSVENSNPELGERKDLDERKEQGEREKWSALLVVGCAAAIIPILAAGIAFAFIIRLLKEKKRRNIQGNYDNISSPNNSPSPHPVKWKEPSSVVTNSLRPKPTREDHNKFAVYSVAIPKKERVENTNVVANCSEYAEIGELNFNQLNYAEIVHENRNANGPVVERAEPNYSAVTEMQTPSRDDRYCNVFEQGTYINADNTTEYVEPAYCYVKTHE